MKDITRTILVIEDEKRWQNTISRMCNKVHEKLYNSQANIIVASTLSQAIHSLQQNKRIHFASIDLNLANDNNNSQDPSGLKILKAIYDKRIETISIVVSGEINPDFSSISKKYGVLTFQQKNKPSFSKTFQIAVEGALLYIDAEEAFTNRDFNQSLKIWIAAKQTVKPIEDLVGGALDWTFPRDIEFAYQELLKQTEARFKHPVTNLPTTKLIEEEFARLLTQKSEWLVLCTKIKGFEDYLASQGHPQGDVLLEITKDSIIDALQEFSWSYDFFGQTLDNLFVLSFNNQQIEDKTISDFQKHLNSLFVEKSGPSYDYITHDRQEMRYNDIDGEEKTAPLASLAVGGVQGVHNKFAGLPFGDIRDLDQELRQATQAEKIVYSTKI